MGTEARRPLRIFFLPLMTPGHMFPMIDMAKLFAARGPDVVSATIITTPGNESLFRPSIASSPIELLLVPFPDSVAHLVPRDKENLGALSISEFPLFFQAWQALQDPIEQLLFARRPHCLISDYILDWTADAAIRLHIPRIIFYGRGIFASCVNDTLLLHRQHEMVSDDSEAFVVEGLPHRIQLTRSEVSAEVLDSTPEMRASVDKSYGVVVNSFYELEPEYAELYRKGNGTGRAYYVGPVSLRRKEVSKEMGADRGQRLKLMTWLDSMEEGSVMYVCFGTLNEFSADKLREIALGLEASGRPFVWAVRSLESKNGPGQLPDGFEERVEGKGMVIKGWVPQTAILNHPAVGGFVTHCGWNSTLESVAAGVPMVTWPVEYEQFANEKLITQVLQIGVSVGRGDQSAGPDNNNKKMVKTKQIAEAVEDVMSDGPQAEERRARVRKYAAMAKAAREEGGSSFKDMTRLIEEIWKHTMEAQNNAVQ